MKFNCCRYKARGHPPNHGDLTILSMKIAPFQANHNPRLMKIKFASLLILFFAVVSVSFAQQHQLVKVKIKGEDNFELIRMADLLGIWTNISGVVPILSVQALHGTLDIQHGSRVRIQDEWAKDLPGKLGDLYWQLTNDELAFKSPSVGEIDVAIEKFKNSNVVEITVNSYTYRKTIMRSDRKKS